MDISEAEIIGVLKSKQSLINFKFKFPTNFGMLHVYVIYSEVKTYQEVIKRAQPRIHNPGQDPHVFHAHLSPTSTCPTSDLTRGERPTSK